MTFFDFLTLIGGLSLFLFGMNLMGDALEKRAGNGLKNLLGKLTSSKAAGFSHRRGHHGGDPVVICHNGDGGGLCKLRPYGTASGYLCYYGCQRRHHCNGMGS